MPDLFYISAHMEVRREGYAYAHYEITLTHYSEDGFGERVRVEFRVNGQRRFEFSMPKEAAALFYQIASEWQSSPKLENMRSLIREDIK